MNKKFHLKSARVNAGFKQVEVAEKLGISKNTITSYEKYRTKPSIEMSQKMADLYGLTVDDIIFFAD